MIDKTVLGFFFCFLMLVGNPSAWAEDSDGFIMRFSYIEDNLGEVAAQKALELFRKDQGHSIPDNTFNKGSRESSYWLWLKVHNPDEEFIQTRLLASAPYRLLLEAQLYRQEQSASAIILEENQSKPFSSRQYPYHLLASTLFDLRGGETVEILIRYHTRGSSFLPLSIVTEEAFHAAKVFEQTFTSGTYSFAIALGLFFFVLSLSLRNRQGVYYALLYFSGLLLLASIDGYAFQFLWPNFPVWNNYSSLVILFSINALGYLVALKTASNNDQYRFFRPACLALMFISLLAIVLITTLGFTFLVGLANILLFTMFTFQFISVSTWGSLLRHRLSLAAMGILTVVIGVLAILFFISDGLPATFIHYSNYLFFLAISLSILSIVMIQMVGLRKDREAALVQQLDAARQEAELNRELFEAEKKYARAQQIAHNRKQKLATVSHDIKQPLVSLRSGIDSLRALQNPEVSQQLLDAIKYLEQLCNAYLEETNPAHHLDPVGEQEDTRQLNAGKAESYPLTLIFQTLQRLFGEEASANQINLRAVPCSVMTEVAPLILIRIVSNLVANAIKHANADKILIGCRRLEHSVRIEVRDDGKGMSPFELVELQKEYSKGEQSDGEGLGLAITRQLAEQHHLKFSIYSQPGHGSCFAIELPVSKLQITSGP